MARFRVISADSHVVEPPDLWLRYIRPEFRERAPHLEHREDTDVFVAEEARLMSLAIASAAGSTRQKTADVGDKARWEGSVRAGAYDPEARIADMNQDGIDGEFIYPTLALRMFEMSDQQLLHAVFEAYNTWAWDFCKAHPDRIKGAGVVCFWDTNRTVEEMHRIRELGLAGVMIAMSDSFAQSYGDTAFDSFWATAQELALPVTLHLRTNARKLDSSRDSIATVTVGPTGVMWAITDLIFTGICHRFPKLRIVSAENDAGWAAYLVERMDTMFERWRYSRDFYIRDKNAPSEYFRRNVLVTFQNDRAAIFTRHLVGIDNLLWASDYPHKESTFPHSQQVLQDLLVEVPADEQRKIVGDNAAGLYGF